MIDFHAKLQEKSVVHRERFEEHHTKCPCIQKLLVSVKNIESQLEHHLQIGGPYDCYPVGFVLQQQTHWYLLQEDAPSHADATDGKKPLHSMIHKSSHFLSEQPFSSSMREFLEKRQRQCDGANRMERIQACSLLPVQFGLSPILKATSFQLRLLIFCSAQQPV